MLLMRSKVLNIEMDSKMHVQITTPHCLKTDVKDSGLELKASLEWIALSNLLNKHWTHSEWWSTKFYSLKDAQDMCAIVTDCTGVAKVRKHNLPTVDGVQYGFELLSGLPQLSHIQETSWIQTKFSGL